MDTPVKCSARALIEKINRELTLDGAIIGTRFESLVRNSLEILSSQLYTKSTHFLLELIQNADDNTYTYETPTLNFSYKPGSLRIDCNEVGFTAENVEALCAISKSTKVDKSSYEDSIGEKGIGFKSVFKAADVVWISSGQFTFKFDKTKCLGMVTPVWAEFPGPTQPGYTSMYLQLSQDYDEDTLVQELLEFDSNFLIFLRRIQHINISVDRQDSQVWEKRIRKQEYHHHQDEDHVVILHSGEDTLQYLIRTHHVKDLPEEKMRVGCHQTKLLLAFPTFDSSEQPQLTPQNVYAFLPIRNYGFNFLIQGDFLLTANREDIESTLPWNQTIRAHFIEAFLEAIDNFNKSSMRYTWPHFLPSSSTIGCTFFEPTIARISKCLQGKPMLESCDGKMARASSLKYVLLEPFVDSKGIPFTLGPLTESRYLSLKYPTWATEALRPIGLLQLSPKEFLEDLKSAITYDTESFNSRSSSWHSELADTLIKLRTNAELIPIVQDIPIVPLSDGNWTSARGKAIFFSKSEGSLQIPDGIEVLFVDSTAESDPTRRSLFTSLGVKNWEASEICRVILKMHQCSDFDPKTLTTAQLVSHAVFLYKASWQSPKKSDVWFATMEDKRCLGRELYIPGGSEKDSPMARIFLRLNEQFPVIHNDYLTIPCLDQDWPRWLVENLGLSNIPRLISPQVDPKPQPTHTLETHENCMVQNIETTTRNEIGTGLDTSTVTEVVAKAASELAKVLSAAAKAASAASNVARAAAITACVATEIRDAVSDLSTVDRPKKNVAEETEAATKAAKASKAALEAVYMAAKATKTSKTPYMAAKATKTSKTPYMTADTIDEATNAATYAADLAIDAAATAANMPSSIPVFKTKAAAEYELLSRELEEEIMHEASGAYVDLRIEVLEATTRAMATARWVTISAKAAAQFVARIADATIAIVTTRTEAKAEIKNAAYAAAKAAKIVAEAVVAAAATTEAGIKAEEVRAKAETEGEDIDEVDLTHTACMLTQGAEMIAKSAETALRTAETAARTIHATREADATVKAAEAAAKTAKEVIAIFNVCEGPDIFNEILQPTGEAAKAAQVAAETAKAESRTIETDIKATQINRPFDFGSSPSSNLIFNLSEEFTFMFRECHTSDILQILKDNWNHYSQWIDETQMKWQCLNFVESSANLRNVLGDCIVETAKGSLPLRGTVLPMLDQELEEGCRIPAVDIQHPLHSQWSLLAHFNCIVKADVHYYLRCLTSISGDIDPDIDKVSYIYQHIQERFKGNENIVRAAFQGTDMIFLHSEPLSSKSSIWVNMEECLSKGINMETKYPNSSYLFQCLSSPTGDPIASKVAMANHITSLTKLEDILRFFRSVSTAVKDIHSGKATQLLKHIQGKPIFPIKINAEKDGYDTLLNVRDTTWFIADKPLIWESFHGKLPLLAFRIEDLAGLDHLFHALRLDERILSKHVTNQAIPGGQISPDLEYTSTLREKAPFIKSLVPQSHNSRSAILHQINELRVRIATEISQTFKLDIKGRQIHGNAVHGQVSISNTGNSLVLFMTNECARAECPPYELVSMLADKFGIKDPAHYSLLYTVLSNSSVENMLSAFSQQGIRVEGIDIKNTKAKFKKPGRASVQIPSLWNRLSNMVSCKGSPDALSLHSFGNAVYTDKANDRRLPMVMQFQTGESGAQYSEPGWVTMEYDQRRVELQHMGEHLVSKTFQSYLGPTYNPERDWTSDLRVRSGYRSFENWTACSAFTIRDPLLIFKMTRFITEYGSSQTSNWEHILQESPPVYHIDLVVSSGGKSSVFKITSSQIERMRKFQMQTSRGESSTEIAVLIRVSDVYSKELSCLDIFIDPWKLFNSNKLTLESDWILEGTIRDDSTRSCPTRRKISAPSIPWAAPTISNVHRGNSASLRSDKQRVSYPYKALYRGMIRLLFLFPGTENDPLQGIIVQVPYKSAGAYRALSYVWGTNERSHELITPDGVLGITCSLDDSLRRLRHKAEPLTIWVDAICINQADNKEKSQQIRVLPKIFQQAGLTYAFIGDCNGSDAAIEMLMQVQAKSKCDEWQKACRDRRQILESEHASYPGDESDYEGETDTSDYGSQNIKSSLGKWPEGLPKVPGSWKDRRIPRLNDDIWADVKALFSISWFRRMWIIQETVATPRIIMICGKWRIGWDELYAAMKIVAREIELSEDDISSIKTSWKPFMALAEQREWETRGYRWALIMLLEAFRFSESTLCRDRLFALLGLAADGDEAEFEPDYDIPLEEVVLKFARVFVRQERGMQLLYHAGLNDQSHRFPSWIPDWTVKRPSSLHETSEDGHFFAAAGPQGAKIRCCNDTNELLVEGYEVDMIENITESSNVALEWEKYFNEVDAMIDSSILTQVRESMQQLKWKVPVACMLDPKVAAFWGVDMESSYKALRAELGGIGKGKGKAIGQSSCSAQGATHSPESQSAGYIAALKGTLEGWRFVVTERGYVGVVPNMAEAGDIIAILKGGAVPFILRKSAERPAAFRLIGGCYIHGIMYGEGLSLPGVSQFEFCLH